MEHDLKGVNTGSKYNSLGEDIPHPDGPWVKAVLVYILAAVGEGVLHAMTGSSTRSARGHVRLDVAGSLAVNGLVE